MSLLSFIGDALTEITASVTKDRELSVIASSYPPISPQKVKPFRQYFTDDGLPDGTSDMGVDGSTNNVDYFIDAAQEDDRYVAAINFIVAYGTTGQPNQWANGTALTNGLRIFYSSTLGEVDIHDGVKTNQDFFRLRFDGIPTAWEVRHVNANNDYGYFVTVDLTKMGFPFGVKLDRGSKQRLTVRVRDNAGLDADTLNAIAYGIDRFE
jgi:hypothetical protein